MLFQVHFLALLLEERGAGDLAAVADHCVEKLIRRHPHVFGTVSVDGADEVRRNWDEIKRTSEGRGAGGLFGDTPENLPALSLATRVQRRAGEEPGAADGAAVGGVIALAERLAGAAARDREARLDAVGELLFGVVRAARALGVDPELALRRATSLYRDRAEGAATE